MKKELKEKMRQEILNQIKREAKGKEIAGSGLERFTPKFSDEIMDAALPQTFRMPNLVIYDGKGDSFVHVNVFKSWIDFE